MDDPNYQDFVKYLDELVQGQNYKGKKIFIDSYVKDAISAIIAKYGIKNSFTNKSNFVSTLNQLVLNSNIRYEVGKWNIKQFITIYKYCIDRNTNIFKDIDFKNDRFVFKSTPPQQTAQRPTPVPRTPAPASALARTPASASASALALARLPSHIQTSRSRITSTILENMLTIIQKMPDDYIFYNVNQYPIYDRSIDIFKSQITNEDNRKSFQEYLDILVNCNPFPLLVYYIEHYILNYLDDDLYTNYTSIELSVCQILNIFSAQEKDSVQYNKFNIEMETILLSDVKKSIIPEIENYIKHNTKVKTGGKFKIKNYKKSKNSYKNKKSKNSYKNKKSKTNKKTNKPYKSKNYYKNKKSKKSKKNKLTHPTTF